MKKNSREKSFVIAAFLGAILFFTLPQKSFAYDNDTHFWLTYYLAVKAGYTPVQATQIASADISVDFDKDTQPVVPRPGLKDLMRLNSHFNYVRWRFHALASKTDVNRDGKPDVIYWWDPTEEAVEKFQKISANLVNIRKNEFWEYTLDKKRNPGFFLHYLQDVYAHRNFKSYIGHAGYFRVDFLASDRAKAKEMAFDTLRHLLAFKEVRFNKKDATGFADASKIKLEDYLSAGDIAEIETVVEKFCAENTSKGTEPNGLIDVWNNLKEDKKKAYSIPPVDYMIALAKTAKKVQSPDSKKARKIVMEQFGYSENEMPLLWVYDYDKWGNINQDLTKKSYRYTNDDNNKTIFTALDERNNIKLNKGKAYKNQCLPFDLVPDSTTSPVKCE